MIFQAFPFISYFIRTISLQLSIMLLSTITRKTDSVYHICHAFCTFVNVILYNRTWHASYKGMKRIFGFQYNVPSQSHDQILAADFRTAIDAKIDLTKMFAVFDLIPFLNFNISAVPKCGISSRISIHFPFWSDTFPDPVSSLHFWLNSVQK